jgi:hypothetical protein
MIVSPWLLLQREFVLRDKQLLLDGEFVGDLVSSDDAGCFRSDLLFLVL